MGRKIKTRTLFLLAVLVTVTCFFLSPCENGRGQGRSETGTLLTAKVEGKNFYVQNEHGRWKKTFVNGINIGTGTPGHWPGEFGADKTTYLRWFEDIAGMNINTIRVYVAQSPEFYEALYEYNQRASRPLYLMQGVYLNENFIATTHDAYAMDGKLLEDFVRDIENVVDIIHGRAEIEKVRGSAGGTYRWDISQYVTGWIFGIEWSADFVNGTNSAHLETPQYQGRYLYTQQASPFEIFLATAGDQGISYEMEKYGQQRPAAFSNWVTTDPLIHPNEPDVDSEDSAVVDVERILTTDHMEAGVFASYHVYPYYPDFFSYDPKYQKDTPPNPYAAYLNELNQYHSMPVLVAEYGVPTSRGLTHKNEVTGLNQGNLTEKQQGEMIKSMNKDIRKAGCMGGLIFSWQDEWFKTTWNTDALEDKDSRPYWGNMQSPEQNFGLLSFEPGEEKPPVVVDGNGKDWNGIKPVSVNDGLSVSAEYDSKYLYLKIDTGDQGLEQGPFYVPIDTIQEQGNEAAQGRQMQSNADFLLVIDDESNSKLLVDPYYDALHYEYAAEISVVDPIPHQYDKNSGEFVPIYQMLSNSLYLPQTKENIPVSIFETGLLTYGIADPESFRYNSLSDFYEKDGVIEVRLPWMLLNISDPSQKKVLADFYTVPRQDTHFSQQVVEDIRIGVFAEKGSGIVPMGSFSWKGWDESPYHERYKESYFILRRYFGRMNAAVQEPLQTMVYALVGLMAVLLVIFVVSLVIFHFISNERKRRLERMKESITTAIQEQLFREFSQDERKEEKGRSPFGQIGGMRSVRGLMALDQLCGNLNDDELQCLRSLLQKEGYQEYLQQMNVAKNLNFSLLCMKLVGRLKLQGFEHKLKENIMVMRSDTDVQYVGLSALTQIGSNTVIEEILCDPSFQVLLSFRSLQEIAAEFKGDKEQLFLHLLEQAQDSYIRRMCLKRIGSEKIQSLAPIVMKYVEAPDFNTKIDAIRTLGQLEYKAAVPSLIHFVKHEKWEIRSAAIVALASIDLEHSDQIVLGGLFDREWWVRYRTAEVLNSHPDRRRLQRQIEASKDRFAMDIFQFAGHVHTLREESVKNEH